MSRDTSLTYMSTNKRTGYLNVQYLDLRSCVAGTPEPCARRACLGPGCEGPFVNPKS